MRVRRVACVFRGVPCVLQSIGPECILCGHEGGTTCGSYPGDYRTFGLPGAPDAVRRAWAHVVCLRHPLDVAETWRAVGDAIARYASFLKPAYFVPCVRCQTSRFLLDEDGNMVCRRRGISTRATPAARNGLP